MTPDRIRGDGRPARPARPGPPTLAELARDPAYLEVKERMGEPLTPAERELLDAARAGRDPRKIGGAP
jgi:hypothetical protein